jgi:hypothetical protein
MAMKRATQIVLGAALAFEFLLGAMAHQTASVSAAGRCHTVDRITFWVITGIDSEHGGTWCHH